LEEGSSQIIPLKTIEDKISKQYYLSRTVKDVVFILPVTQPEMKKERHKNLHIKNPKSL